MNQHTMMSIVTSYMEFASLRRIITRDWHGFTKRPGYHQALAALYELERNNMGGYIPESGVSHPEFLSPHAFFTFSSRAALADTVKTSTRLVGPSLVPEINLIKEILSKRKIDYAIYQHVSWNKPHVVILVEAD